MAGSGGEDEGVRAEAGEVVFEGALGPVEVVGVAVFAKDGGAVFDDDAELFNAVVGEEDGGFDTLGGRLGTAGGNFAEAGQSVFAGPEFDGRFENGAESRDSEGSRESVFFVGTKKVVTLFLFGGGYHVGTHGEERVFGGDGFEGYDCIGTYRLIYRVKGLAEDNHLALVTGDGEIRCEQIVDVRRHGSIREQVVLDGAADVQRISTDSQSDSGATVGLVGVAFHVSIHNLIRNGGSVLPGNGREFA